MTKLEPPGEPPNTHERLPEQPKETKEKVNNTTTKSTNLTPRDQARKHPEETAQTDSRDWRQGHTQNRAGPGPEGAGADTRRPNRPHTELLGRWLPGAAGAWVAAWVPRCSLAALFACCAAAVWRPSPHAGWLECCWLVALLAGRAAAQARTPRRAERLGATAAWDAA